MKILKTSRSCRGNTLLMTIVVTGLIVFLLAAYMTLLNVQNGSNVRSQSWNSAMPVVEAGIEEAMAHLNSAGLRNETLASDGWTQSGNTFSVSRAVGESFYTVSISNYIPNSIASAPVIESKGYVVKPLVLSSGPGPLLAVASPGGVVSDTVSQVSYLGRGVRVQTRRDAIFAKGMVAKQSIDMKGNDIRTDSFDSTNPLYSSNGTYVASLARDNGDVAVNSSVTNSLNAGNADIRGKVAVGPGGTIAVGVLGSIGSDAWHDGGNTGIESGHSSTDMNVSFPDVLPPFNGGAFTPSGGWITNTTTSVTSNSTTISSIIYPGAVGFPITTNLASSTIYPVGSPGPVSTNTSGKKATYTYPTFAYDAVTATTNTTTTTTYYDYILDSGNYQLTSLNGSVYVRGEAVLYVTSTLSMSALVIQPGQQLNLYSAAPNSAIAGNITANSDGTADSFVFWGLPTCTSLSFSGNASFTGAIYAPNADFSLDGGGNNTIDFIGASITKSVQLNGHFNFHYDEALAILGPSRGYIVSSWNEMLPSDVPVIAVAQ